MTDYAQLAAEAMGNPLFPSPNDPMSVARRLLNDYEHDGLATLKSWRGGWMKWESSCWIEIEGDTVKAAAYDRLEKAEYYHTSKDRAGNPTTELKPWNPNRYKIVNVLDAVRHHPPGRVSRRAILAALSPA